MTTNIYAIETMVKARQREIEAGIRETRLLRRVRRTERAGKGINRGNQTIEVARVRKPGLRLLVANALIRAGNRMKERAGRAEAAA